MLIGCSGTGRNYNVSNSESEININNISTVNPEIEQIINPDRSLFYGKTLTIATDFGVLLQDFARRYMEENRGVTIEIIDYWPYHERDGSWDTARQEIATQLMTGSAPVLINAVLTDSLNPRITDFFYDWFPVMYADPYFYEADWFMNVFHAASNNGRLYEFPLDFDFSTIGINSSVTGLYEQWAWRDTITASELIKLHEELQTEKPYYITWRFVPSWVLTSFFIDNFIDLESNRIDFGKEFIEFITNLQNITNPFGEFINFSHVPREVEIIRGDTYLFEIYLSPSIRHRTYEDEFDLFLYPKPIVNEQGELLIRLFGSFLLNANASPIEHALAWDFIKFTSEPLFEGWVPTFRLSTNKNMMRYSLRIRFSDQIQHGNWRIEGNLNDVIESEINNIIKLTEMPMSRHSELPATILRNISQTMIQFDNGLVSAEATASTLQNQVELMLMEMGIR